MAPRIGIASQTKEVSSTIYKCDYPGCTVEYISETGRTFGDRYKENLRIPSSIYDHANTTGHSIKLDSFFIMDRDSQGITKTIKEVMFIRVKDPPLTRTLASTSYHTSGMGCYRIHWLLHLQQYPLFHTLTTVPLGPPHYKGGMDTSTGKYLPPTSTLAPKFPTIFWHQNW